jgi:hypothetical protein
MSNIDKEIAIIKDATIHLQIASDKLDTQDEIIKHQDKMITLLKDIIQDRDKYINILEKQLAIIEKYTNNEQQ